MDSFIKIKLTGFTFFLIFVLTACGKQSDSGRNSGESSSSEGESFSTGTHLDADPLEIIGVPIRNLVYDVAFEFQFGASGGDGVYRYRYIKDPELTEEESDSDPNPLELTVESDNGAKPAFWLRGIPRVPDGEDFDSISPISTYFGLEVSDGKNTVTQTYNIGLDKNKANILGGSEFAVTEGTFKDDAESLFGGLEDGLTTVCEEGVTQEYLPYTLPNGQTVIPWAIRVQLDFPVAEPVRLYYRISSRYSDSYGERSDQNIKYARPGVDFIEEERSVFFDYGKQFCVFDVKVLDDGIVEDDEEIEIEFYDREGAHVDIRSTRSTLTIRDNEPDIFFDGETLTRNTGDTISSKVRTILPAITQLHTAVKLDEQSEPFDTDLFSLNPSGGQVTIQADANESVFSIDLKEDVLPESGNSDPKLIFNLDVSSIFELDDLTIWVNDWAGTSDTLSEEIVARASSSEDAVSIAQDPDSNILVAVNKMDGLHDSVAIKGFDYRGNQIDLTASGDLLYAVPGVNVEVLDIHTTSDRDIIAVAQVDGLVGASHYGGKDILVVEFGKGSGDYYSVQRVSQHGTEADDEIDGSELGEGNNLYIWGGTTGTTLDGQQPQIVNSGGRDGFIYKVDVDQGGSDWSQFIGSELDDMVKGLDASTRQAVVLLETTNLTGATNASIRSVRVTDGFPLDTESFNPIELNFDGSQDYRDLIFSGDNRYYFVAVNSSTDLSSNLPSASSTQEIAMMSFKFGELDRVSDIDNISSDASDTGKQVKLMSDEETLVLIGDTQGQFTSQISKGGTDVVISLYDLDNATITPERTMQFGTPGDDAVLDVLEAHEGKFMVLWSEDFSAGDGSVTYRVSPFSIDGEKLTADPQ